jgi:small subunit ribosomal protein S19e
MANIFEVDSDELVRKAADRLKGENIPRPAYIDYVKSSPGKERIPTDQSFWYMRCASILRQTYVNGPIGVSKLRTRYGSRMRHTVAHPHHKRAGGSIIKDAFDTLEKAGYVKKTKEGRVITSKGKSFLDKVANEVIKGKGA